MRIISWNCNRAFRHKYKYAQEFDPDIIVIQESEHYDVLDKRFLNDYPNRLWFGDNRSQGVLVLSKAAYPLKTRTEYQPEYKYIIPIDVSSEKPFCLFAIWAQKRKGLSYSQQVFEALQGYSTILDSDCILVGDFNSNSKWDSTQKDSKHTQIAEYLEGYMIRSSYHVRTGEIMGSEIIGTHAFRRDVHRMYHLDYCFMSKSFLESFILKIPLSEEWIKLSDHAPMIVDIKR
jgi:exodeoxyribonuclease III